VLFRSIDVRANDGTLLMPFKEIGCKVLGIEPSQAAGVATGRGIAMMKDYFSRDAARRAVEQYGSARIVTAANVFAHIPDPHGVVDATATLLADEGVFVSESGYLRDLVETLQYDTIYHEHLRYYSLTSLGALFGRHGFRIVRAKRIPTHGGSIRVYATRAAGPDDPSVGKLLEEERSAGLADESWVPGFRERVLRSKLDLYRLLAQLKSNGERIYGIGAPSRASTLVTYVGLDDGIVDCVLEIPGSKKIGRYMPGTAIPVLDESKLYEDQPEYALLLSWHIAGELTDALRSKGFRGRFIVPLPSPHLID